MSDRNNVINLPVKRRSSNQVKGAKGRQNQAPVLDMTERREAIIQQERRRVRRTILSEFVGVHVVVPQQGLMPVHLYDISDDGLSFDIPVASGRFRQEEELAMRVYLNHQTYFPFTVKVANVRVLSEEAVCRHGVNFVKGALNEDALRHFVKFIESVSASLETDSGDVMVSKLFGHR